MASLSFRRYLLVHAMQDGLRDAIRSSVVHEARMAITSGGASPNFCFPDGVPMICLAVRYSTACMVDMLVEHGANVNAVDMDGANALWYAAYYRRANPVITALIKHGIHVGSRDKYGQTAMDQLYIQWRTCKARETMRTTSPFPVNPCCTALSEYRGIYIGSLAVSRAPPPIDTSSTLLLIASHAVFEADPPHSYAALCALPDDIIGHICDPSRTSNACSQSMYVLRLFSTMRDARKVLSLLYLSPSRSMITVGEFMLLATRFCDTH